MQSGRTCLSASASVHVSRWQWKCLCQVIRCIAAIIALLVGRLVGRNSGTLDITFVVVAVSKPQGFDIVVR